MASLLPLILSFNCFSQVGIGKLSNHRPIWGVKDETIRLKLRPWFSVRAPRICCGGMSISATRGRCRPGLKSSAAAGFPPIFYCWTIMSLEQLRVEIDWTTCGCDEDEIFNKKSPKRVSFAYTWAAAPIVEDVKQTWLIWNFCRCNQLCKFY